jgi:hypothetical protein
MNTPIVPAKSASAYFDQADYDRRCGAPKNGDYAGDGLREISEITEVVETRICAAISGLSRGRVWDDVVLISSRARIDCLSRMVQDLPISDRLVRRVLEVTDELRFLHHEQDRILVETLVFGADMRLWITTELICRLKAAAERLDQVLIQAFKELAKHDPAFSLLNSIKVAR